MRQLSLHHCFIPLILSGVPLLYGGMSLHTHCEGSILSPGVGVVVVRGFVVVSGYVVIPSTTKHLHLSLGHCLKERYNCILIRCLFINFFNLNSTVFIATHGHCK